MNIMAEQPGAPFHFSMDGDDNMEISSPHTLHDQDIDIDFELGDGEDVIGEDENMLEDAPRREFLDGTGQAQPTSVDDEMADDIPTPKEDSHVSFAFAPSDFNPEANDLDLIDDGEDYAFGDYQEIEPSNEVDFAAEPGEQQDISQRQADQESAFQGHLPGTTVNNPGEGQPSYGDDIASEYKAAGPEYAEIEKPTRLSESRLSQDQTSIQKSEGEEQSSFTLTSQTTLDHAEALTTELAKGSNPAAQNALDVAYELSVDSNKQDIEELADNEVHQESYPDSEVGHDQSEVGLDDDGTDEHRHPVQSLHPIVVKYQNEEMSLFQSKESEVEHSPTFLLQDQTLASQSILELLYACRDVLAGSMDDSEELNLRMDVLGLDFCETTVESTTTSIAEVLDIYLQLCFNEGIDIPEPLVTTLSTKPRLAHRLELLRSTASEGGSLSTIAVSSNDEELDYENDENEEQQNVQGKVDQPPQDHKPTDTNTQSEKNHVPKKAGDIEAAEERHSSPKTELASPLGYLDSNVRGTSTPLAEAPETGGATETVLSSKESAISHDEKSQHSHNGDPADVGIQSGPYKEVESPQKQLDEPNHDNDLGPHGSEHGTDPGFQDLDDRDVVQDFELNFDQTTAGTEGSSDLRSYNPQDANKDGSGVDNTEEVALNASAERPGSSSGSSTVKGDTAIVDAFTPTKFVENISKELELDVATHDEAGSDLDAVADLGQLKDDGEEDELTWDDDEELPPLSYHETTTALHEENGTNTEDQNSLNGFNNSSEETPLPKVEIDRAFTTDDPEYDSDEITYDEDEFDTALPAIAESASRKVSESLKGSPTSIKRGRTSDEELDHDQLEGQGEAKRVKSM